MDFASFTRKAVACISYIVISGCLIRFNKKMMADDHFPHSLALSALHMIVSCVFCIILYWVAPSLYPAMEGTRGNRQSLLKWFVPIGICFAVMLFGSNTAYKYCSVTFLQFMKEANVMICFIFSCIIGLQTVNRLKILVIIWVCVSASICISGEVQFAWVGFVFQAVSQLAEVARMIMGEIVLSGHKLDPLTYTMFLAPICLVVLVIANILHFSPGTWPDFARMWPLLIGNACVAFALNVSVAATIKECSAVGFVLVGTAKDIVIVLFSACAFHEKVTGQQVLGFVLTIAGLLFWTLMKSHPEAAPIRYAQAGLCMPPEVPGESAALLGKAKAPETRV